MWFNLSNKFRGTEEFSQISWFEGQWEKKRASAQINCSQSKWSICNAVEVEADLKTKYLTKLKIDYRNIPDPFKISHGWIKEDEGMKFWPMLLYSNVFNCLMFSPSELGIKNLNGYKNCKVNSYHESDWLQPLLHHNLTGSNFCILKGECRKSQWPIS